MYVSFSPSVAPSLDVLSCSIARRLQYQTGLTDKNDGSDSPRHDRSSCCIRLAGCASTLSTHPESPRAWRRFLTIRHLPFTSNSLTIGRCATCDQHAPLKRTTLSFLSMSSSSDVPPDFRNDDLSFPEIDEPASPEELQQHCNKLVAFRKAAHRHLLHPGWSFTSPILPYHPNRGDMPLQPQRPLPDFALRGGDYRFILKDALQPFDPVSDIHSTYYGQWSQVWVADVQTANPNAPLSPSLSLGSVVLKIFQSSLFPIPRVADYSNVRDRHLVARELANTEFFIYERMRSLQGECVPYCFGRSKVSFYFEFHVMFRLMLVI